MTSRPPRPWGSSIDPNPIDGLPRGGSDTSFSAAEERAAEYASTMKMVEATKAARAAEKALCGPPTPAWMADVDVFADHEGWWANNGYEAKGPYPSEDQAVEAAWELYNQ